MAKLAWRNMRRFKKISKVKDEAWATPVTRSISRIDDSTYIFVNHRKKINEDSKKRMSEHENDPKKSNLEQTFLELVLNGLKYFFQFGTLHGLRYMVESSKSLIERVIWIVACIMSTGACNVAAYFAIMKWINIPFIAVVDNQHTPLYEIPFPKVLICPENTVKRSHVDVTNITDPSLLFAASLICDAMPSQNFSLPDGTSPEEDVKIIDFLKTSSPKCEEMIKFCRWISSGENSITTKDCCSDLFDPILTNKGMCFGFNML